MVEQWRYWEQILHHLKFMNPDAWQLYINYLGRPALLWFWDNVRKYNGKNL